MAYFRLISVFVMLLLLGGCLTPPWEKKEYPPEMKDHAVTPLFEGEEEEEGLPQLLDVDEDLPIKEMRAGQLISFPNLKAADPDGDPITYAFSEPLDENGEWQTAEGDEGTYLVTITASDGESTVSQNVYIVVSPSNYAPEIEIEDTITVKEGELLALEPVVTDKDGDDVEISYSGWRTAFPYRVGYGDAGIYTVTIFASDGKKETEKSVDIIVEHVNQAPIVEAIKDKTVTEHDTLHIIPKAKDPDGDELFISFSDPFDLDGVWKTGAGDAGVYEVSVEVTDGEYIVDTSFTLTVKDFNDPPVISGAEDITVFEGDTVVLDVDAYDPEGDAVKITISGWMTTTGKKTGYTDAGVYAVVITASDGEAEAEEIIVVTVKDVNRPPTFNPGAFS